MNSEIAKVRIAGKIKWRINILGNALDPLFLLQNCPTNPLVPIPAPSGIFSIGKIVVATGLK